MISGQGKSGAVLVLGVLLIAIAGWWLGSRDKPQPVADAPAQTSVHVIPRTFFDYQKPTAPVMGPFTPPIPAPMAAPMAPPIANVPAHPVPPPRHGGARPAPPAPDAMQPQAWMRHAQASPANPGNLPLIAIVIDDLGVAPARVAAALALPAPMTMAVLPYASDAAALARRARLLGHEVLVHLPMEATNGQDPGPHALLATLTPAAFAQNMQWNLSRLAGYVGVNNHMGSRLTQNSAAMAMVMQELKRRGLLFLDSRTARHTLGASTARATGVTALERDVFLDNVITPEMIRIQIGKAEEIARRKGYAIAIGHPHPATINALTQWAAGMEARGFRLAPLSAIARMGPSGGRLVSLPPPGG